MHLLIIDDSSLFHFLAEHRDQGGHSLVQLLGDQGPLDESAEDVQQLEDGLRDQAVVEWPTEDRAQLAVELERARLELLVVLDEALVRRVQAVVGPTGKERVGC